MIRIKAFAAALVMITTMATPGMAQDKTEIVSKSDSVQDVYKVQNKENVLKKTETPKNDVEQTMEVTTFQSSNEEQDENEQIESALLERAHRIDDCLITYYCPERCCNGSNAWRTSSGMNMVPGVTVGVDRRVIPLGSDVMINYGNGEIHYYKADDTGVKGNHVDVLVENHQKALDLGIKRATVYWVEAE